MRRLTPHTSLPPAPQRRSLLRAAGGLGLLAAGLAIWPETRLLAQQVSDFISGPPMPDIPARQLSPHVRISAIVDARFSVIVDGISG